MKNNPNVEKRLETRRQNIGPKSHVRILEFYVSDDLRFGPDFGRRKYRKSDEKFSATFSFSFISSKNEKVKMHPFFENFGKKKSFFIKRGPSENRKKAFATFSKRWKRRKPLFDHF